MSSITEVRRGPGRPPDPDKRNERRTAILAQAMVFFARDGFVKTDMASVAEAAGCSKGTIYNYFENKQALFRDAVDHAMDGLVRRIDDQSANGDIDEFGRSIEAFLRYFDENPAYIELLMQERAAFKDRETPTYLKYCERLKEKHKRKFEELIRIGTFRPQPVGRLFDIIGDLLYGTIFTNYFAKRPIRLKQQAQEITGLLLKGLLARPGDEPASAADGAPFSEEKPAAAR